MIYLPAIRKLNWPELIRLYDSYGHQWSDDKRRAHDEIVRRLRVEGMTQVQGVMYRLVDDEDSFTREPVPGSHKQQTFARSPHRRRDLTVEEMRELAASWDAQLENY